MHAIDRLRFGGRVPPRIKKYAVIGLGQVEAEPPSLETDQEDGSVPVPELRDDRRSIAGAPVEIAVRDTRRADPIAGEREEPG